jgi:hypothetical protein
MQEISKKNRLSLSLSTEGRGAQGACPAQVVIFWVRRWNAYSQFKSSQVTSKAMSLNDLEFAFAPVRDQVRDLREYL